MAGMRHVEEQRGLGRLWTRSILAPRAWSAWLPAGLAAVAPVTAAEALVDSRVALTSALAIVALAVGLGGRRGDALVVAAVALVVGVAASRSGGWDAQETVTLVVILGAGVAAALVALLRATAVATARQLDLLRDLLALAGGGPDVGALVDRVLDLVVPAVADACMLDLLVDDEPRRLGARAAGAERVLLEAALLRREPPPADGLPGAAHAIATGEPQLVEAGDEALLLRAGHGADDMALVRRLAIRSALFLPLATRGPAFGAMSLVVGRSGRGYTAGDLAFLELVAGRVAIVLDNAGLTREVARTEARMIAALDSLEEAVTMNGPDGRTVYVNDAAVRLLRASSAAELYDAQVGEISSRFAIYDEAGAPVDVERLPAFRALRGEDHPPPMLVRNVVRATGEERWLVNKVSVLRDPDGAIDRVVNVIEDVTDVKQAELSQRLLAEATRALSSSLEYERTLQHVAEVAVPELADWCGVDLPGHGNRVEQVAIAHADPGRRPVGVELRERYPIALDSPTALAQVVREGGTAQIDGIDDDQLVAFATDEEHLRLLRAVGFGSILVVGLVAGGESLGALTLVRSDPVRRFSAADRLLAEELGRRAGIAVLNARLYSERAEIARELQAGLMPPALPTVTGLDAATLYRPAGEVNEVGGDFYDAFPTPGGWMVVIGDVAGQGARAAALTGLARFTVRAAGQLTGDPAAAAAQLNATLRDQPELSLCTVAVLHLHRDDAGRAALSVLTCGHPLPVLVRDGATEELGEHGPLAGAFDGLRWCPVTRPLADGDAIVLYTDGVLDTVGADGRRFGEQRLHEVLRGPAGDAGSLVERVDGALGAFQQGPQSDDTAIVVLRVRDAGALAEAVASGERARRQPR